MSKHTDITKFHFAVGDILSHYVGKMSHPRPGSNRRQKRNWCQEMNE